MKNLSTVSNPLVYVMCNKIFRAAMWKEFERLSVRIYLDQIWQSIHNTTFGMLMPEFIEKIDIKPTAV